MVLGISEDLTSNVTLDSELASIPNSGIYLNSGVHPSITVENLLDFLPKTIFNFTAWSDATNYGVFSVSRNKRDLVSANDKIYQSIKAGTNNEVTDAEYWLETNIESLRIKTFIQKVQDRVYSDLNLNKRLVNSQYLYEEGDHSITLPNDYAGWMIQPKGSDYVSFRVNEISLQKDGTTPVNLYVINQKTLLDTITVTPNNGQLNFQPTDLVLQGKGEFKLVIDSTDVYRGDGSVDPLKFNGFVATTVNGTGDAPESAKYTYDTTGNGIGLNLSAFLDATSYIEDNLEQFAPYIRVTFELMCFEMFLHNSNNRSNRSQRIQMRDDFLINELKNMQLETVVRRYHREKKRAIESIERTFDTQLKTRNKLTVKIGSN